MDENDIVAEIVMERMVHRGSFLLLEGATDLKRFRPFVDQELCSMVICNSVQKAFRAMKLLKKRSFKGALAVLDRDFNSIRGIFADWGDIIRSENHDLDLDWIHTEAVIRYLAEVGDEEKILNKGGVHVIVDEIHKTLRPVSTARYLGVTRLFRFKTSGVDVGKFFVCGEDICAEYCNELATAGYVDFSIIDWMIIEIKKEMKFPKEDRQMNNGHDFSSALGKMLRSEIGCRKTPHTWGSEVETHIRLSFRDEDFLSLSVFRDIVEWENRNYPYKVLSSRLRLT